MQIIGDPALIMVDVQRSGEDPEGVAGIPHMPIGAAVVQRIRPLVACCRELDVPVVFIQEVHKPSLVDIGRELDGAEGPHAIESHESTKLVEGLEPTPEEFLIRKRRYSGFFATELELVLKSYGVQTLLIVGGLTDVCVHYTTVDAHQHDYHVRVAADAVLGSGQAAHDAALRAIEYLQRDALVTTQEMIEALQERAARREAEPAAV